MGYLLVTEPEKSFDFGINICWFDNSILTSIELFVASCLLFFIVYEFSGLYFFNQYNHVYNTIFSVFFSVNSYLTMRQLIHVLAAFI